MRKGRWAYKKVHSPLTGSVVNTAWCLAIFLPENPERKTGLFIDVLTILLILSYMVPIAVLERQYLN